jgi:hypothetical protein
MGIPLLRERTRILKALQPLPVKAAVGRVTAHIPDDTLPATMVTPAAVMWEMAVVAEAISTPAGQPPALALAVILAEAAVSTKVRTLHTAAAWVTTTPPRMELVVVVERV